MNAQSVHVNALITKDKLKCQVRTSDGERLRMGASVIKHER